MFNFLSRYWWVLVLRGVIAILFGVLAFTVPLATLTTLVLVFGAYALVDGIATIAAAIAGRKMTGDWWILLAQGLLGIGVGILTLLNPALTAVALLIFIAIWAALVGMLQIFAAMKLRNELTGEWWLALGGVLGVAFGVLLIWKPAAGALALLWLIGTYAIVWGVMLMIGGFDVRRLWKHVVA